MTPWVTRLIIANAVVLLLLETVFTSTALFRALAFDPATALSRPWTFFTYMFVHADLLHLLANLLVLFVLGSAVESRMGEPEVPALLPLLRRGRGVLRAGPLRVHAGRSRSWAHRARSLAWRWRWRMLWPDAEMLVFPIPMPIKARTFVILLVAFDAICSPFLRGNDGIAHVAHLGGALFGYLFFRLQSFGPEPASPPRAGAARGDGPARCRRARAAPDAARAIRPSRGERSRSGRRAKSTACSTRSAQQGIESLTPPSGASSTTSRSRRGSDCTERVSLVRLALASHAVAFVSSRRADQPPAGFPRGARRADSEAAYRQFHDAHRPLLDAYWRNYVLDPDSPHAADVIPAALRADRRDLYALAATDRPRAARRGGDRARRGSAAASTGPPTSS